MGQEPTGKPLPCTLAMLRGTDDQWARIFLFGNVWRCGKKIRPAQNICNGTEIPFGPPCPLRNSGQKTRLRKLFLSKAEQPHGKGLHVLPAHG